jgi:hypothetical protein
MTGGKDRVADDEELYRRVRENVPGHTCFKIEGGRVVFLNSAFNDVSDRPSVDRAKLRQFDPHRTRLMQDDGIVALQTAAIRQLGPIPRFDNHQKPITGFVVDVLSDPVLGNCAHAVVVTAPPLTGKGAVRRLKEGLVRLANDAGWRIEPGTSLPRRNFVTAVRDIFQCLLGRFQGLR